MHINFDDMDDDQLRFAENYYNALDGSGRSQVAFSEALALPQLPKLMQPILDAEVLDLYDKNPAVAERFSKTETIDQINRAVEYQDWQISQDVPAENNGETFLGGLPKVLPEQPYPKLYLGQSNRFLRTTKRGESIDIQWETIYNSRGAKVSLIPKAIQRFLDDARDTDDVEATRMLVTRAGINTAVLGTTGHVAVSGGVTNPPLTLTTTVQVIADAIAQSLLFKENGRDVVFNKYALVVAPAKVPLIKQALTGMSITFVPGSTGGAQLTQKVDLGAEVDVVGNPWLTSIWSGGTNAWFLIPMDGRIKGIVRVKAEDEESPSIWVEGSNAFYYPAGGEAPALVGKFTDETWSAKVRYVVEGGVLSNAGIIYSNGSGS